MTYLEEEEEKQKTTREVEVGRASWRVRKALRGELKRRRWGNMRRVKHQTGQFVLERDEHTQEGEREVSR